MVFAAGNQLYAKFLRWFFGDRINHCFLFYESDAFGGWMAVEVDESGINPCVPEKVLATVKKMECYELETDLVPGLQAMKPYIGQGYDWLGMLNGVFWLTLYKAFGVMSAKARHASSRMFCSEYVTSVCRHAKVPFTDKLIPALTWPPLLRDTLLKSFGTRRVRGLFGSKYEFDD